MLNNNLCTNLCAKLALQGSRSDTSKSINFICTKYGIIKYDIVKSHRNEYLHVVNDFVVEFMPERAQLAGLLYDILCTILFLFFYLKLSLYRVNTFSKALFFNVALFVHTHGIKI